MARRGDLAGLGLELPAADVRCRATWADLATRRGSEAESAAPDEFRSGQMSAGGPGRGWERPDRAGKDGASRYRPLGRVAAPAPNP